MSHVKAGGYGSVKTTLPEGLNTLIRMWKIHINAAFWRGFKHNLWQVKSPKKGLFFIYFSLF